MIREMTTDDINEVIDLKQLCYPTDNALSYTFFQRNLNRSNSPHLFWVAVVNSNIVGLSGCEFDRIFQVVYVSFVMVHPEWRRKNIGSQLTQSILSVIKKRSVMAYIRASNSVAELLFQKLNFKHSGTHEKYFRDPVEDAKIMVKETL